MSGSTFCPWPIQEAARQKAQRLASKLGCPVDTSRKLVDCLKTKPARDIVRLTQMFQVKHTEILHAVFDVNIHIKSIIFKLSYHS